MSFRLIHSREMHNAIKRRPSSPDHGLFHQERPEKGPLIDTAEKHGPALAEPQVPQAAVDVKRIHVVFDDHVH